MTITDEAAQIVGRLTDGQKRALDVPPAFGFIAGSNRWYDVTYHEPGDEDAEICDGEHVDAAIRMGLISVGDYDESHGVHLIDDEREVEARCDLALTPLGLAVKALLMQKPA